MTGLISLVHRGAHASGLLLVSPLFAVTAPENVFAVAAVAIPLDRPGRARSQRSSSRSSSTRDESNPSILSIAPGGRRRSARRHQTDELRADDRRAAEERLLLDARDDVVQRRGLPVLDVHAHLDEPRARQVEAERAHSRKAAAALADERRHLLRGRELAAQIDVERDQRASGADEDCAGGRVEALRPEVRRQLAGVDPALELVRAAAPEERGPAAVASSP